MSSDITPGWAQDALDRAPRQGPDRSEEAVLARIEKVRRRRPRVREERITLAHGAGGKATATLIDAVFLEAFRNPALERLGDGAAVEVDGTRLAFTTDSYVVSPLFFPGGDIGDLAVNGTVNDLAMCGARPLWLSAGFVLEEGFAVADLERIVASMARAAAAAGVSIVTGDTKVVGRGKADGLFVTTAGVGVRERPTVLDAAAARPGDVVLVSGPIGDHGVTILIARGELDIDADLASDTAPLHELAAAVLDAGGDGVRVLRDATRGGVATILNEIAVASDVAVVVDETTIPVRPEVARGRRAARDRPALRGVRGPDGGRRRRGARPGGAGGHDRPARRRRGGGDRAGGRRPAGPGAAAHRLRRHADRRRARR